jgi:hypothetical protein
VTRPPTRAARCRTGRVRTMTRVCGCGARMSSDGSHGCNAPREARPEAATSSA